MTTYTQFADILASQQKYHIVYADPPWSYKFNWGNGSNTHTYTPMTHTAICHLPIQQITASTAHLYLWVTNPFLKEGLEICSQWGFTYKTLLTWVKTYRDGTPEVGMGYYYRGATEHMIFGTKGKGMKILNKTTKNVFHEVNPRWLGKKHSAKPTGVREMIVECSGNLPRIELFARNDGHPSLNGWDLWGDEAGDKHKEEEPDTSHPQLLLTGMERKERS